MRKDPDDYVIRLLASPGEAPRHAWNELLADYNLLNGRLWLLVLVTTLVAPRLAMKQLPARMH